MQSRLVLLIHRHEIVFRCESILLRSHWVLVVIDVFTRRIVGLGVERASIGGSIASSLAGPYRNTSARRDLGVKLALRIDRVTVLA